MIDLTTRPLHYEDDEALRVAAVRYMEDDAEDFYEEDHIIADLLTRLQQEKERNGIRHAVLAEKLAVAGEAWDMTHFGCDNPDHKEAYLHAATVFLPKEND